MNLRRNVTNPQDDDSENILRWVIEEVRQAICGNELTDEEWVETYELLSGRDPVEAYDEYLQDPWL